MTGLLNNATVDIECPSCGRKIKQRLGGLNNNKLLRCICGTSLSLSTTHKGGIAQGMKTVDKSLKSLEATLKKLGK
ncbi:MAG TPA: hypothetical protein VIP31_05015 [Acidovorax sp.]